MRVRQIKETCLYVQDLEATRRFYEDKLGLPVMGRVEGRHIFFRAGSSVLLCFIAESTKNDEHLPPHFGTGTLHLAFEVSPTEYNAAKAKLLEESIEIEHEHQWPGGFKSVYFRDPDNHCIEIVQTGMWEV